jgi:hypothetical protein
VLLLGTRSLAQESIDAKVLARSLLALEPCRAAILPSRILRGNIEAQLDLVSCC